MMYLSQLIMTLATAGSNEELGVLVAWRTGSELGSTVVWRTVGSRLI